MASPRLRVPHVSRLLREVGILTLETLEAWGAVQVQMSGKNFISVLLLFDPVPLVLIRFNSGDLRARIRRRGRFRHMTSTCRKPSSVFTFMVLSVVLGLPHFLHAQAASSSAKLSVHWEELTASDFRDGIHRSQGTCLLPFGILEKHAPHLPIGTDLLDVRYAALPAAAPEAIARREPSAGRGEGGRSTRRTGRWAPIGWTGVTPRGTRPSRNTQAG